LIAGNLRAGCDGTIHWRVPEVCGRVGWPGDGRNVPRNRRRPPAPYPPASAPVRTVAVGEGRDGEGKADSSDESIGAPIKGRQFRSWPPVPCLPRARPAPPLRRPAPRDWCPHRRAFARARKDGTLPAALPATRRSKPGMQPPLPWWSARTWRSLSGHSAASPASSPQRLALAKFARAASARCSRKEPGVGLHSDEGGRHRQSGQTANDRCDASLADFDPVVLTLAIRQFPADARPRSVPPAVDAS
jgi:hypothetical protein